MKKQIDLRSVVLGVAIGVAAMLMVGASGGSVGRYQVAGTASAGLVVDTATGRVWSKYFPQQSGSTDPDFESAKSK